MNETPSDHEGGAEPPEQRLIPYVCPDCRRTFSVPARAPSQMDGLAIEGLTCPWCGRWAMPAQGDLLAVPVRTLAMRTRIAWACAVTLVCLIGALGYLAWTEKDERETERMTPPGLPRQWRTPRYRSSE